MFYRLRFADENTIIAVLCGGGKADEKAEGSGNKRLAGRTLSLSKFALTPSGS
jgi:hypothetical protein